MENFFVMAYQCQALIQMLTSKYFALMLLGTVSSSRVRGGKRKNDDIMKETFCTYINYMGRFFAPIQVLFDLMF
jgi:hypothetical protein